MSDKQTAGPTKVTVDRDELLHLLDHVDSLVRFCSVSVIDVGRYTRGSTAMWAVVHRLAGNDEMADRLIRENSLLEGGANAR